MRVTRRGLQLALAVAWLVDGVLQCQPFMFTGGFAREVLRPAADGQPAVVGGPVHLAAAVVAAHPFACNAVFAAVQLALGLVLLHRRWVRVALVGTVVWSLGVWWLGEGLGGVLSGHAMLLTGAPGAVLLYALVAVAAWPGAGGAGIGAAPRRFAVGAWAAVWLAGALVQTLPGQNTPAALSDALNGPGSPTPGWLAGAGQALAHAVSRGGAPLVALVLLQALVGLLALVDGFPRWSAVATGVLLAAGFWVFGQGVGELFTGRSTDPNSGPLLILLGVAAVAAKRSASSPATAADAQTRPGGVSPGDARPASARRPAPMAA